MCPTKRLVLSMKQKKILLNKKNVAYALRVSPRATRLRLTMKLDGNLILTVPRGVDEVSAERFLIEKQAWVLRQLDYVDKLRSEPLPYRDENHYRDYRQAALLFLQKRVGELNRGYGFAVSKIGVRNQKARWGSCSWDGHLNFNYKILFLPENLQDYLIVHELCHMAEMNHGKNFWKLVGQTIPECHKRHAELRAKGPRFY